jgi:hypothetical protein
VRRVLGICWAGGVLVACTRPAPAPAREPLTAAPGPSVVIAAPVEPASDEPVDDRVMASDDRGTLVANLGCGGATPSAPRSAGGLIVPVTPAERRLNIKGRLRSHIDGTLSARGRRTWVGPPVPSFVPLSQGTLELFLLDPMEGGYFALYRDPYDASSCKLSGSTNCAFEVAAFDCSGATLFRVALNPFFSRKSHLEVQDVRLDGRIVYFNEACQSYSREAQGKCSSLVALDPYSAAVLWRTPPLVSNNRFLIYPSYIVTGYGFTSEPDHLYVVRRTDGRVVSKESLPRAHEDVYDWQGAVVVELDSSTAVAYRRVGFDGPSPQLERLTALQRAP